MWQEEIHQLQKGSSCKQMQNLTWLSTVWPSCSWRRHRQIQSLDISERKLLRCLKNSLRRLSGWARRTVKWSWHDMKQFTDLHAVTCLKNSWHCTRIFWLLATQPEIWVPFFSSKNWNPNYVDNDVRNWSTSAELSSKRLAWEKNLKLRGWAIAWHSAHEHVDIWQVAHFATLDEPRKSHRFLKHDISWCISRHACASGVHFTNDALSLISPSAWLFLPGLIKVSSCLETHVAGRRQKGRLRRENLVTARHSASASELSPSLICCDMYAAWNFVSDIQGSIALELFLGLPSSNHILAGVFIAFAVNIFLILGACAWRLTAIIIFHWCIGLHVNEPPRPRFIRQKTAWLDVGHHAAQVSEWPSCSVTAVHQHWRFLGPCTVVSKYTSCMSWHVVLGAHRQ